MHTVFLHGLGQTASAWEQTISHLSLSDEILCPDLFPMIGGQEVTYSNLYRAFSDYCAISAGRIRLCGLSLGAILALNYTIDHPERVESLVLMAPQYKMPRTLLNIQNAVFRLMPEKAFLEMGLSKKDVISFMQSTLDLDFTGQLDGISCRTLILCGEKDRANKKSALTLSEKIPGAGIQFVEGAGHELNRENPRRLGEILNQFFAQA